MYRRHPAHVTADRLKDHYERIDLCASEQIAFERVIAILEAFGDGDDR